MKHQWLAYVIVALVSVAAGVAIGGLPDNAPANATITPTTIDGASETTAPETDVVWVALGDGTQIDFLTTIADGDWETPVSAGGT